MNDNYENIIEVNNRLTLNIDEQKGDKTFEVTIKH